MGDIVRLEKSSVFFRFLSDAAEKTEKVEFYGRHIAVCDLKRAIADKYNLSRYDLELGNSDTNEIYNREGALLPRNIIVTVKRTPIQSIKKPTLFMEGADIWSDVTKLKKVKRKRTAEPIRRSACPPEYLCPLCKEMYDNPCIARCCGRSACFDCFETQPDDVNCPLCQKPFNDATTPIPNPKLAQTVDSLNLDYFELPGGKVPQMLQKKTPEVVDLDPEENSAKQPPKIEAASVATPSSQIPSSLQPVRGGHDLPPPPPDHLERAWSGESFLPFPPSSPPPFPWSPPPSPLPPGSPGAVPCMLSAEQFAMWQQSLHEDSYYSDSYSDERARKKKKKKERKKKKEKKRKRDEVAAPPGVFSAPGQSEKSHRKSKKRKAE